jgi:DNA-binding response OmpR family regulator
MRNAYIAIVDDEAALAEAYAEYLADLGAEVMTARSAAEFDRLSGPRQPDLVVLDLNMPGEDGLSVLRRLREQGDVPVLILTGNADPIERVVGLELGADDFIVKPVDPRELAARISGILERFGRTRRDLVSFERSTADLTASRLLSRGPGPERLSPGEVMLIRAFASRPGQVLSREELIQLAPAESADPYDRAIDTRIARLRQKLETEAIVTIRGRGYMFVPPEPDRALSGDEEASRG